MSRILTVLFMFALIVGGLAGVTAAAYFVGGAVESLAPSWGLHRLTNILFLMLVFVMVIATFLTLAERKWSALMQDRIGPNYARIHLPGIKNNSLAGIPHMLADVLKMLTKEDFMPANANKWLFALGPILAFAPAFALFAVVPAGPTIDVLGQRVDMVVATPDFGILYIFAIASLAVYGTALAGWSSNNKFALLGGVRATSQMISYEVALGLGLVGLMMCFSTVQLPAMVGDVVRPDRVGPLGELLPAFGQGAYLWRTGAGFDFGLPAWGIFLQPIGFVLFFAASFAEAKRAPFDAPEGESEIIGYFVEYSGMKFGMFMISEFIEVVVLGGVLVALFFGGHHLPFGEEWLWSTALMQGAPWLMGVILGTVFWLKVLVLIYVQLNIRWSFMRFRYDQIQTLGWKMLLPAGILNIFVTGALVLWDPSLRALAIFGLLVIATVIAMALAGTGTTADSHGIEPHGHGGGHGGHGHGGHAEPAGTLAHSTSSSNAATVTHAQPASVNASH